MEPFHSSMLLGAALREMEPVSVRLGALTRDLATSMQLKPNAWTALADASKGIGELVRLQDSSQVARGLNDHVARLRAITFPGDAITGQVAGIKAMAGIGALTRSLIDASRFTAFGDLRLNAFHRIAFEGIASLRIAPTVADFACISDIYSKFLKSSENAVRILPATVVAIPAREYFFSAEASAEVIEEATPEGAEDERESARKESQLHVYSTVEEALSALDVRLLKLWRGAVQAAASDNPDKLRHAITSLRELFTQVMHRLAPDADITSWSTNPEHFDKDRPTRRARLQYILTGLDHEPFTEFLGADIESMLKLIRAFQGGTHNPDKELSIPHLRLVFHRAGSTLCSLIEARTASQS